MSETERWWTLFLAGYTVVLVAAIVLAHSKRMADLQARLERPSTSEDERWVCRKLLMSNKHLSDL